MALLLIIIYITFISMGLPGFMLGAAWPSMYVEMAAPASLMGIISIIITGSTVIAALLSGKSVRRFQAGIFAAVSVSLIAAGLLGFASSGSFIFLCVYAIPLGLGIGLADAILNNFVTVHFKAMHMNWLHCCWGIGATAGPVILAYGMRRTGSWRWGYMATGILLVFLAIGLFLSLPVWKKSVPEPVAPAVGSRASLKFAELLRIPGVKLAIGTLFFYNAIETSVGLWGSSYLVIVSGFPAEKAAEWISLFFLGITLGRLLSGFLSSKMGGISMVRLGSAIFTAGGAIVFTSVGGGAYPFGLFIMGVGCSPIFPSLVHMIPAFFGKEHSQAIIGVLFAGAYIGSTIIPPLFGPLASSLGYETLPVFLGALLIIMAVSVERLRKTAAGTLPENSPKN